MSALTTIIETKTMHKVAQVTIHLWITKICTTILVETADDLLSMSINVGYDLKFYNFNWPILESACNAAAFKLSSSLWRAHYTYHPTESGNIVLDRLDTCTYI